MIRRGWSVCVVLALALLLVPQAVLGQGVGVVAGRVLDTSASPLEGASVQVEGTRLETWTDATGRFRLAGVPAGKRTIVVTFVGFTEKSDVEVQAGGTAEAAFKIELRFAESVTVIQPLLEGQARALAQQQAAPGIANFVAGDQISSFPDPNVAEAAQRISGVTLLRDDGEGSQLVIRGVDPRMNSVAMNGARVPSTTGTDRTVDLRTVPTEILQGIEVHKAITPDMDGDAIGGAVNLITKQAPEKQRVDLSAEVGYNHLVDAPTAKVSLTFGRRFAGGAWGLVASGSAQDEQRGEDSFVNTYVGTAINEIELIDAVTRYQRYSANAALDWLSPSGNTAFLRGTYTLQDHDKIRRRVRLRNIPTAPTGGGEYRPEIRDRDRERNVSGVSTGAKFNLNGKSFLDMKVAYSLADNDEPNTVHSRFRQRNVTYNVAIGEEYQLDWLGAVDPTKAAFNSSIVETYASSDRDFVAQAHLLSPFGAEGVSGYFKFGGKYIDKRKKNARSYTSYTGSGVPALSAFESDFEANPFFEGRYTLPAFPSIADNAAMISKYNLVGVVDHSYDPENFKAGEKISSGFGMAEARLTDKFTLVGGARYEYTSSHYDGYIVTFSEAGTYVSTAPSKSSTSYGSLLPMLHAKYALTDRDTVRMAVTRTLARPDYWSLAPYQQINPDSNKILRGNPGLQETNAWSVDLMAEHYFKSIGVASAGLFYKNLSDYVYLYAFDEVYNGEIYRVQEPRNGPNATIYGVEVALQNRLSFLPKPFDGLGIYANYTYSHSEAEFPGRPKGPLPAQARHTSNLALSYEKGGFSGRVALNYVGNYLADVTDSPDADVWWDTHAQMDVYAQQRLTKNLSLYVTALNVNNSRDRGYLSIQARPEHDEILSWWGTAGLRLSF